MKSLNRVTIDEELDKELKAITEACKQLVARVTEEQRKLPMVKEFWEKGKTKVAKVSRAAKAGAKAAGWSFLGVCGVAVVGAALLVGVTIITGGTAAPITAAIAAHAGM